MGGGGGRGLQSSDCILLISYLLVFSVITMAGALASDIELLQQLPEGCIFYIIELLSTKNVFFVHFLIKA